MLKGSVACLQQGLQGEKEAREHAMATGHQVLYQISDAPESTACDLAGEHSSA